MIFFRLCKVMLISLLIKNNFYDNKLLKILLKNVYGCGSIPIKMVQWSLPSMKIMGINKDILDIFENSYEKCPIHDIEHTNKQYEIDFNRALNDDYTIIDVIGSGSIAQVYKVKDKKNNLYAMKVKHPNSNENYIIIKRYLLIFFTIFKFNKLIPVSLYDFLKQFEEQLNFINESNNILKFNDLYKNHPLYKIPTLLKISENIIIMEYLEGKPLESVKQNNIKYSKYNLFIYTFINNNLAINNFNHGDLHNYNWKISSDKKVVIYDYGLCWELKYPIILDHLHLLLDGLYEHNDDKIYSSFKNMILLNSSIDENIIKSYYDKNMNGKINRFIDFSKNLMIFSIKNSIILEISLLYIIISWQNTLIIFMNNYDKEDNFDHNSIYTEEYNICDHYNMLPDYQNYLKNQIKKYEKNDEIDYSKLNKFID